MQNETSAASGLQLPEDVTAELNATVKAVGMTASDLLHYWLANAPLPTSEPPPMAETTAAPGDKQVDTTPVISLKDNSLTEVDID